MATAVVTPWLSRTTFFVLVAWAMLMLSGFSVVYTSHQCRLLTGELAQLLQDKNSLEIAWGQNLLEASAEASLHRVERLASDKLDMKVPGLDDIIFIQ